MSYNPERHQIRSEQGYLEVKTTRLTAQRGLASCTPFPRFFSPIPVDLFTHNSLLQLPHIMSKKFKSQASSSRAATSTFGSFGRFSSTSGAGREPSSLTYVAEPPDLSRISEPQLAIAFKNFLKKDEVTRTKSLDDLNDYISSVEARSGTLDDGFLEAWVCIQPVTQTRTA